MVDIIPDKIPCIESMIISKYWDEDISTNSEIQEVFESKSARFIVFKRT